MSFSDVLERIAAKDAKLTRYSGHLESFTDEEVVLICRAMRGNTILRKLVLVNNTLLKRGHHITDDAVAILAKNTTLIYLDLSKNRIGDTGAEALARNTTLVWLSLNSTEVGDKGAAALAQNTTLTTLCLRHDDNPLNPSELGDNGALALARNTTLRELFLDNNIIGDGGAMALACNTTLMTLSLFHNCVGSNGAIALSRNTTLTTLYLKENDIGDDGEAALAQNTTLHTMCRYDNCLDTFIGIDIYAPIEVQQCRNRDAADVLIAACHAVAPSLDAVAAVLTTGVRPYGRYIQSKLGRGKRDTLLHLAVRLRRVDLVDLLLAHGADADRCTENKDGVTYRELAKEMGVPLSSAFFGTMPPLY